MGKREERKAERIEKKFQKLDEEEKTHPGWCQHKLLGAQCLLKANHAGKSHKYL